MSRVFTARVNADIDDRQALALVRAYNPGGAPIGRLGATDDQSTMPTFDMKRDIVAGALAFALPLGYSKWAEKKHGKKKWPELNMWQSVLAVVGVYFGTVIVYEKLKTT